MIKLTVDNTEIEAEPGANLLHTCLESGIYIPNLCHLKEMSPAPASCRLCFVEIEGMDPPVASCTIQIWGSMQIHTDTPAVRRLQKSALQLLLSVHDVNCKPCPANKECALHPMGRWGQLHELEGVVIFLAAPASDFITGQTIYIDGGWTAC